ncbi:MAG: sulfite exporter TauE/SafE family protein, partial [Candidatus Hydrogenedentes bacterium]|nr:sulfite exporter TauE/SafE family protein [Candidatus Hydrogenedentota bacterium]
MEFLLVAFAFGLGGFVQTIAGFGSALVAIPLATLAISVRTAAPAQALMGFVVTLSILQQNWHGLRWYEAKRLIAGSVFGVPLGAIVLKNFPSGIVIGCMGVMLMTYGIWLGRANLAIDEAPPAKDPGWRPKLWAAAVGWIAGVLAGAYATDGPPLIMYGTYQRWPKATFKSVLQCCFLVNGVSMVVWHGANGLITAEVIRASLFALPGAVIGTLAGRYADRYIDHDRFQRLLRILILVLGAVL